MNHLNTSNIQENFSSHFSSYSTSAFYYPSHNQPRKKPLAHPKNVVFLYDGTFFGFLCCVHKSVYSATIPMAIMCEEDALPTLFDTHSVCTDQQKAIAVADSIPTKISRSALQIVHTVFLSCLKDKELKLLRFLLLGYHQGGGVSRMQAHPDVAVVLAAQRHLLHEAHLLKGFIRFSDTGGVLSSTISPKNFILPFLQNHFTSRFPNENFIIYDKTHHAALIYEHHECHILPVEHINFSQGDERDKHYQNLWKLFYDTIAISERENPKCRMSHMPKRYWENMLEVQHLL